MLKPRLFVVALGPLAVSALLVPDPARAEPELTLEQASENLKEPNRGLEPFPDVSARETGRQGVFELDKDDLVQITTVKAGGFVIGAFVTPNTDRFRDIPSLGFFEAEGDSVDVTISKDRLDEVWTFNDIYPPQTPEDRIEYLGLEDIHSERRRGATQAQSEALTRASRPDVFGDPQEALELARTFIREGNEAAAKAEELITRGGTIVAIEGNPDGVAVNGVRDTTADVEDAETVIFTLDAEFLKRTGAEDFAEYEARAELGQTGIAVVSANKTEVDLGSF